MRSLVFFIITISLLTWPLYGRTTDPPVENKTIEARKGSAHEEFSSETKSEIQPLSNETSGETSTITKSTEIKDNRADNGTLSKFNYLLYFIYKHKYQDKEIFSLEEKI